MNRKILLTALLALSACTAKRATDTAAPPPVQFAATLARVASINVDLQFVVLDFSGRALPPIGTRLNVYRGEELIGTVQITDPVRGRFATADIVRGDLRVGDEVR